MSRWHRLAHLQFQPIVKVGQYVTPMTIIGYVGTTGNSTGPHVHHDGTVAKPKTWYQYKSRPLSEYFNTEKWAKLVLPYSRRYLTSQHGLAGHIGVDINVAPQDLGLPVYSPVNGRVQFIEKPVSVYRFVNGVRKLIQPTWGGGFGNFLWIEEDMAKPSL